MLTEKERSFIKKQTRNDWQTSAFDMDAVALIVERLPKSRMCFILEVGTGALRSTAIIATEMMKRNPTNILVSIDDYSMAKNEEYVKALGRYSFEKNRDILRYKLRLDNNIIILNIKTDEFIARSNMVFDAIYHDGSHEVEQLTKDILGLEKKLLIGGWFTGHDYGDDYEEGLQVKSVVDKLIKDSSYYTNFTETCGVWSAKKVKERDAI